MRIETRLGIIAEERAWSRSEEGSLSSPWKVEGDILTSSASHLDTGYREALSTVAKQAPSPPKDLGLAFAHALPLPLSAAFTLAQVLQQRIATPSPFPLPHRHGIKGPS